MDPFANIPKMEQRDETILKGAQRTKFDFDKNFDHSNIPLKDEKFPVIIIGSSMVGMSLGVLLGYYGYVSSLVMAMMALRGAVREMPPANHVLRLAV
jgi:hypothetical protein